MANYLINSQFKKLVVMHEYGHEPVRRVACPLYLQAIVDWCQITHLDDR